ncbi:unnamed protein product [Malus baccata var. baccata]
MGSKSKRASRLRDRISDLPDSVLCHILSFLQTKYSNMWAAVPSIDLDNEDFPNYLGLMMFVDRVLLFRGSSDIENFRLDCHCMGDFPRIDAWIRTAIMRNVAELDLCVEPHEQNIFELPKSLFMCKTLRVLKLMSSFVTNTPTSWCLPSLKSLSVAVRYPDNDLIEKFLSRCRAVEDLTIHGVVGEHEVWNFNISALGLKTLRIDLETAPDLGDLENFDFEQIFLSNCELENAKSLVKATIHFNEHFACECPVHASRVTTLLLQICNVKCLSLAAHCLEVCQLPAFANLSQLKLVLNPCYSWWVEFLQRSPVLEYLVLDFDVFSSCGFESELVREYPHFQFKLPKVRWNPPDFVPSCLLTHLKTICITRLMGRPHEMEVAKFLLENGKVLKRMTIHTCRGLLCTRKELYKKFLMFHRASNTCEYNFLPHYIVIDSLTTSVSDPISLQLPSDMRCTAFYWAVEGSTSPLRWRIVKLCFTCIIQFPYV